MEHPPMEQLQILLYLASIAIVLLLVWAQVRTADEVAKIRKLLEGEIHKR